MRDDRNSLRTVASFRESKIASFLEVHHRVGVEVVDHAAVSCIGKGERTTGMGTVVTPALSANTTGSEVVHARLYTLIAEVVIRAECIDLVRRDFTEICDEFGHFFDAAPEFVAKGEHTEGGMMTIPAQDVLTLFM